MTALAIARSTDRKGDRAVIDLLDLPVKASTVCYQGGIAVIDAGYAAPGRAATGLRACGMFQKNADNSTGSAGAIRADIRRGTFCFNNSTSGDLIAQADVGKVCYIVDDQTVAKTDGSAARSPAGTIIDVDAQGVWVEIGVDLQLADKLALS